ncbi:hypothetical protein VTH82DRAFT_733 [Thermothelomyces myriococcoides]
MKNDHLINISPNVTALPRYLQSDSIAALGVLLLELEANRKASWVEEDEDLDSGEKSNSVRLARILHEWEDLISDDYRKVAEACLEFDRHVETLDHPRIILFGRDNSLTTPLKFPPSRTADRNLFDDDDGIPEDKERKAASVFIERLSQFLEDIKNLKMSIGLEPLPPKYERTRIVVLDSGVDENDLDIRRGIWSGCVNKQKSRSFVGHPDEWKQDTYGHGTYVAQLLLKFAPAAEIYIGKICTGKSLKDELVPGIAEPRITVAFLDVLGLPAMMV